MIDIKKLLAGDRRTLAKAVTLVESLAPTDRELGLNLIEKVLPHTGKSKRIAISGPPGVGKSTFINSFGSYILKQDPKNKLAVLAVDPSSPISGGSILGDKTRMDELLKSENTFIRPSPSAKHLGGVAAKTKESMLLCEAAGYNYILIETVGVGQSEYEVFDIVDFFLLLVPPGGGDELQGIKKGILELAHAVYINKSDGELSTQAKQTYQYYLNSIGNAGDDSQRWKTRVGLCSGQDELNFSEIYEILNAFYNQLTVDQIQSHRSAQNIKWMSVIYWEMIQNHVETNKEISTFRENIENMIRNGEISPAHGAKIIFDKSFSS